MPAIIACLVAGPALADESDDIQWNGFLNAVGGKCDDRAWSQAGSHRLPA